jgi:hypothetical protein
MHKQSAPIPNQLKLTHVNSADGERKHSLAARSGAPILPATIGAAESGYRPLGNAPGSCVLEG